MPGFTPFTSNYTDLSDENGYQFEFRCDICGSGYRSEFIRSKLGTAGNILGGAGPLPRGVFRRPVSGARKGEKNTPPGRPAAAPQEAPYDPTPHLPPLSPQQPLG